MRHYIRRWCQYVLSDVKICVVQWIRGSIAVAGTNTNKDTRYVCEVVGEVFSTHTGDRNGMDRMVAQQMLNRTARVRNQHRVVHHGRCTEFNLGLGGSARPGGNFLGRPYDLFTEAVTIVKVGAA